MTQPSKGPAIVIGPEEGRSFWQPQPSTGYATVKLSPFNTPFNNFSAGIQVLEPGASVRDHAHQRNDELLFVYEGTAKAIVDGATHELAPGSMMLMGRFVRHEVLNTGATPMKMMWIIFPPGLECWFETIGQPRRPGEAPPAPFQRPADVADMQEKLWFVRDGKARSG
jgi:quercetin dioxygenase-like cupin family protein